MSALAEILLIVVGVAVGATLFELTIEIRNQRREERERRDAQRRRDA